MDSNLGQQVLENPIISHTVCKYLSQFDINSLRRVSKIINDNVLKSKSFFNNTRAVIGQQTSEYPISFNRRWQYIKVNLNRNPMHIIQTLRMLRDVKDLKVEMSTTTENLTSFQVTWLIKLFLNKCSKLTSLALELRVLNNDLARIFTDPGVLNLFAQKIQRLEIYPLERLREIGNFTPSHDLTGIAYLTRNLRNFAMIQMPLKVLKMPNIRLLFNANNALQPLHEIVSRNRETLTELDLYNEVWDGQALRNITCPNLRKLSLKTGTGNYTTVQTFIYIHAELETLSLNIRPHLQMDLFNHIHLTCPHLKVLNIKTETFLPAELMTDWHFLQTLTELEEFSVMTPRNIPPPEPELVGTAFGRRILTILQSSSIKKLKIKGAVGFWTPLNGTIPLATKISLLQPFKNLVELSLLRCYNVFDDDTMEFICREFKQLKVFEFSHCRQLTDFGIMDLDDLKKLERLRIRNCDSVTEDSIQSVLRFPALQILEYLSTYPVSMEFVAAVAQQNPMLESLTVTMDDDVDDYLVTLLEVTAINPRIKTFISRVQPFWILIDEDDDISESDSSNSDGSDN